MGTNIVPKTYALLDVMDTLIDGDTNYNLNLIDSLLENNITDVYLFTDMSFMPDELGKLRELISVLIDKGLTIHGVMTVYDLFWGIELEQLKSLSKNISEHILVAELGLISGNRFTSSEVETITNKLDSYCPALANALRQNKPHAQNILGAAYHDIDKQELQECVGGAAQAARIFLKCYPVPGRNFQGFLLKHFMQNKPVNCDNCVIFYSKEEIHPGYGSTLQRLMFENNDVNIMKIKVNQEDFDNPVARINYNSFIRTLLPKRLTISNTASVTNTIVELEEQRNSVMPRWFSGVFTGIIGYQYNLRRGYIFFGYSSDDSLKVLTALKSDNLNNHAKYTIIEHYLTQEQNKGKRLYDVLLEEKVYQTMSEQNNVSDVWLTEDMLYIIKQKYKYERGFKLFGRSCLDSINLLNQLNEAQTNELQTGLAGKQKLIDDYLANPVHQGKRLFYILNIIRDWNSQVSNRYRNHRYLSYQLKG